MAFLCYGAEISHPLAATLLVHAAATATPPAARRSRWFGPAVTLALLGHLFYLHARTQWRHYGEYILDVKGLQAR